MTKIFISYRRGETAGHARNLYGQLRFWFDAEAIFYDVEEERGVTFPTRIRDAVQATPLMLVVIGPQWVEKLNRRAGLSAPDYVRQEVKAALARRAAGEAVTLLPLLMGGAQPPTREQLLPGLREELGPLCDINAYPFHDDVWDSQFVRLRGQVAGICGLTPRFRFPEGAVQPFHTIGHSVSPHFQDPQQRLDQLRRALLNGGTAAVVARAALYGMGGLGKTQLALKYSHDYRDHYTGVWWFRAESAAALQLDAAELCRALGLQVDEREEPTAALRRRLEAERAGPPWLLVFDNAEEPAALRPHLPEGSHHHLLITSRNPAWNGLARAVGLEVWSPEQALPFLTARLPNAPEAALLELAGKLGGLPLALEQAASYMEETGTAVAAYLVLLAGVDTEGLVLDEGHAATGYERSVFATSPSPSTASPPPRGSCWSCAPLPPRSRWPSGFFSNRRSTCRTSYSRPSPTLSSGTAPPANWCASPWRSAGKSPGWKGNPANPPTAPSRPYCSTASPNR